MKSSLKLALLFLILSAAPAQAGWKYCGFVGKFLKTCPASLTNQLAGDSVTDTTTNVSVVSDQTTGILYKYVIEKVSSCAAEEPTKSDLKDGTGSVDFTNDPTPAAGLNIFGYTGLTASSDYCDWSYQESADLTDSNVTLAEFTTLPGGGSLQGWFVDTDAGGCGGGGCSDGNDGQSAATAWLTASRVLSEGLAVGSDVYFNTGGLSTITFFHPDWGGTSGDKAIIGVWWDDGGTITRGLPSSGDPGSPDTAQSTWEGFTFTNGFPTGYTEGGKNGDLVRADASHHIFENINCWKSNKRCFAVDIDSGGNTLFDNVLAHISATASLSFTRDSRNDPSGGNNEVRFSEFSQGASCWGQQLAGCTGAGDWSSCTQMISSSNNSFHHSIVRECWGEGIGVTNEAGKDGLNHIYNNTLIWVRSAGLYANGAANTLFERNIVLGCARQLESICTVAGAVVSFYRNTVNSGGVFSLSWENSANDAGDFSAINNIWRNNLSVGNGGCFTIGASSLATGNDNDKIGGKYIGNTCIGGDVFVNSTIGPGEFDSMFDAFGDIVIENNIYALRPVTSENCDDSRGGTDGYLSFDWNFTDEPWDDGGCEGSNDQENGTVVFANSTWNVPSPSNRYTFADAAIISGDPVGNGPPSLADLLEDCVEATRSNPFTIGACGV